MGLHEVRKRGQAGAMEISVSGKYCGGGHLGTFVGIYSGGPKKSNMKGIGNLPWFICAQELIINNNSGSTIGLCKGCILPLFVVYFFLFLGSLECIFGHCYHEMLNMGIQRTVAKAFFLNM